MNILYTVLLLCMVYQVFASGSGIPDSDKQAVSLGQVSKGDAVAGSSEVQRFVGAVQEGDVDAAYKVFYSGSDRLKEHCGNRLASLGKSELVKLISGAGNYVSMDVENDFGVRWSSTHRRGSHGDQTHKWYFERYRTQCRLGLQD